MYRLTEGMHRTSGADEDLGSYFSSRLKKKKKKRFRGIGFWTRCKGSCFSCCSSYDKPRIAEKDDPEHYTDEFSNTKCSRQTIPVAVGPAPDGDKDGYLIRRAYLPMIWVMGGPGTPIQTLVTRLSKVYKFDHIVTSDLLREEISLGTNQPDLARVLMERGAALPRRFLNEIIKARMAKSIKDGEFRGFLFSDFPPTFNQAMVFHETVCPVDFIAVFKFDENTLKLSAFQQLQQQSQASKTLCRSKADLIKATDDKVKAYHLELNKLHDKLGNKMKVISCEANITDVYLNLMRWVERSLVLHDIKPPNSRKVPLFENAAEAK